MRTNTHSRNRGVGAPETEIEITSVMIEAGIVALHEFDHVCSFGGTLDGIVVEAVVRAALNRF